LFLLWHCYKDNKKTTTTITTNNNTNNNNNNNTRTTTTTTTTTTNIQQTPAPTIAGQSLGKYMNMGPTFLDAGLHSYTRIMLQTDISNNEKKFNLIMLPLVAIFTL
jgi:hypothetical protein